MDGSKPAQGATLGHDSHSHTHATYINKRRQGNQQAKRGQHCYHDTMFSLRRTAMSQDIDAGGSPM